MSVLVLHPLWVLSPAIRHAELEYLYRLRLAIQKGTGFEPIVDAHGRLSKVLVRKYLSLPRS